MECCGSIADFNRATSKLTVYMTTQAPHIIRAAVALVAELPEHMIRIISPDLGGGFGNKVPVYPGYVMSILASILTERPVKWIEDRTGNLISTGFARDVYLDGELALRKDGRILGVRMHTDVRPRRLLLRRPAEQVQDRPDALGVRLLRHPGRAPDRARRLHQQGARRRRLPLLVPGHRGDVLPGADGPGRRRRPRAWTRPSSGGVNFVRDDDFPHRTPFGFLTDSGQYGKCLEVGLRRDRVRRLPASSRRRRASAAGCSASASRR